MTKKTKKGNPEKKKKLLAKVPITHTPTHTPKHTPTHTDIHAQSHINTLHASKTKMHFIVVNKWRPLSKSNDASATLVDNDNGNGYACMYECAQYCILLAAHARQCPKVHSR